MPSTTVVVVCVVVLIAIVLFLVRSRTKAAEPEAPRFEPPREIVKRPAKDAQETTEAATEPAKKAEAPPPSSAPAPEKPEVFPTPPATAAPEPEPQAEAKPTPSSEKPSADGMPASSEEVIADQILESAPAAEPKAPAAAPPPPLPQRDSKPGSPRPPMRSYSNINDESVAEELKRESAMPPAQPKPTSEPKVAAKAFVSEPKAPAAKPKLPVSEPKVAVAKRPPMSEPKVTATKPVPTSEPKVAARKPAEEHDFSALNDAPAAKPGAAAAAAAAAATAAKFVPPPNPATADLEKNDPRHAAARRLARVSVSEIKLFDVDEVKAGREAKDLWKRLQQDIALARQTFEARVVPEVRERFDYLYDEILRQLAEGDIAKLGPEAPAPKPTEPKPSDTTTTATITAPPPDDAAIIDTEAPTRTAGRTLEPRDPPVVEAPKPKPAEAPAPAPVKPAEAGKPTGIAARGLPANPETAELEKNDPRHAAARRLARLSVSEIKLYHEDEVKAGREAKDLWKRMITDIGLATQTYEKRVDKEVRDRFDYLYDEILRQLAEGDVSKLGPDAPKPKKASAPEPAPAAAAPAAPAPTAAPKPQPSQPKPAPRSEPKVEPAPVAAASPATSPAVASVAARYAPPPNPATAELEKNDPRHAAARRLARLSVSEIKLYHEDEVKAGREAKDLWKRLTADIGLATQTYEKRVDKEVRDRFDYLYDEILRQLAEGDASKLGPDAPKPKAEA